ncbi:MAG: hypothetical protein FWF02_05530 [Micrococcales bacterium]|nr:hypothetical protein [Micrococcales bacterium]MCL2667154.1 hypothetical protein [Micrococcales bacterium]
MPTPARRGRPMLLLLVIAVVAVAAAVGGWLVFSGRDGPADADADTVPRVVERPTPTIRPVDRPATTEFAARLPDEVLQYALASSTPSEDWMGAGALQAYDEEFTDGGSATFVLRAGQWSTPEAAEEALTQFTDGAMRPKDATMPASGPVTVGSSDVGRYVIADAGEGRAMLTWSNTTAVLQLIGPLAEVEAIYREFPV